MVIHDDIQDDIQDDTQDDTQDNTQDDTQDDTLALSLALYLALSPCLSQAFTLFKFFRVWLLSKTTCYSLLFSDAAPGNDAVRLGAFSFEEINQRIPNTCLTKEGEKCVFPFKYKGQSDN